MSEFFASYQDLRKFAAVFRRPEIALTDCSSDSGKLMLRLRVDIARIVDLVRKFKESLQLEAVITLELQLLDSERIGIQLAGLEMDAKAIPKIVRKLAIPMIRRSFFERIPPRNGVTLEKEQERVIVDTARLLGGRNEPVAYAIQRLTVEPDGVRLLFTVATGGGEC